MHDVALLVSFVGEIVTFACFAYIGFAFDIPLLFQILLSAVLLIGIIVFWAVYMSPKASRKLGMVGYYLSKLVIYSLGAAIIFYAQNREIGLVFIVAIVVSEALLIRHNLSRLS